MVLIMEDNEKIGIFVDEAAKMLGIGKNLMLKLVTVDGFPAIRFKKKNMKFSNEFKN